MNSWYTNPAWYALAVSGLALVFSGTNYWLTRRKTRADIERGLILQANAINECMLRYGIRGPYAQYFNIPHDQVLTFTGKGVLLLNHVNLLRDVFQHRDILGSDRVEIYEKWAADIVGPWVRGDRQLCLVWSRFKEAGDVGGKEFVDWVSGHFQIHDLSRAIADAD
ncbi:MAG TPA: hypothetical protein VGM82_00160 [Gemmatimonadaceae bacterium]|jgi:hypothetical protein